MKLCVMVLVPEIAVGIFTLRLLCDNQDPVKGQSLPETHCRPQVLLFRLPSCLRARTNLCTHIFIFHIQHLPIAHLSTQELSQGHADPIAKLHAFF